VRTGRWRVATHLRSLLFIGWTLGRPSWTTPPTESICGSVTHAGALLAAGVPLARFGVFEAGMASARDPKYTVVLQRERIKARQDAGSIVS
jgi:hypothetical protein